MPEPPRVYLSMLIETDQAPEDVQLAVLASLSDRYKIISANVGSVGGDDDDTPGISFVVCPVRGLLRCYVGDEPAAEEHAKREGAVVVTWTADVDYRGEVTV